MNCTKAVILVAGFGTRRLPIAKAIEKCMLPILNRPIVDYAVQDCIAAGIKEIFFVISEGATQIKQFYSRVPQLEEHLKQHKKEKLLPLAMPPEDVKFHFIEQPNDGRYGTTVPIWLCRDVIGDDEKLLVVSGDQFIFNADGQSEAGHFLQKAEVAGTHSAMLAMEVPHEEVSKYGIVEVENRGQIELFKDVIEKPSVDEAPTNLNNATFFLFDKKFLEMTEDDMNRPHDGEYFITDVLNAYRQAGYDMVVVRARGKYMDCGTVEGWINTNNLLFEASKN